MLASSCPISSERTSFLLLRSGVSSRSLYDCSTSFPSLPSRLMLSSTSWSTSSWSIRMTSFFRSPGVSTESAERSFCLANTEMKKA